MESAFRLRSRVQLRVIIVTALIASALRLAGLGLAVLFMAGMLADVASHS